MKKRIGLLMLGMLALAALAFTACDMGTEGEYWVTFENWTSYTIEVNCTSGSPSLITLDPKDITTNMPSRERVLFTNSNIKGLIVPTIVPNSGLDFDTMVETEINGLTVLFKPTI